MRVAATFAVGLTICFGAFVVGTVREGSVAVAWGAADATPGAGATWRPVTVDFDGSRTPSADGVRVARLSLEPGAIETRSPDDPPLGFVVVEAGTPTVRAAAPLLIHRRGDGSTPEAAVERLGAGDERRLGVGDFFVDPGGAVAELRNDGDAAAALLSAAAASDAPTVARIEAATPEPGATRGFGRSGWPSLVVSVAIVVAPPCGEGGSGGPGASIGTPGAGGGGTGTSGVAVAVAAGPDCSRPGGGDSSP